MLKEKDALKGLIKYPTIREIVINQIRDDLLNEKLAPEQILNISELAEKYNVSVTPIREALTYFESLGLVKKVNYKNIRVAKFLSDEVEEIYYMRAALSGLAARNAAIHMSSEDKEKLLKFVERGKKALKERQQDEFLEANKEFHGMLSEYIKTPILRGLSEQFYIITKRHQIFGFNIRGFEELISEHENIAIAVYNGDAEKAEYYGRMHYIKNIEFMNKSINNNK